jgi:hypothetical protein
VRTTLTLDEDVRAKLEAEMRKSGKSFRETVNEFLRVGLTARREARPAKLFEIYSRDLHARPGLNFDNIEELLDQVESPMRR